jgi:hypothetical protein
MIDPIDVNRTAEALGSTGRAIPPPAWPGDWGEGVDVFDWPETPPPTGEAAAPGPIGDGFEALPGDAADAPEGV